MNIIAIDSATGRFSVALAVCAGKEKSNEAETWLFEADAGMRHSQLAIEGMQVLIQKAGLEPKNLDGVVCCGGPGSFTGLRIGFSAAKGLALSLGIPFAPIPTLDCMTYPLSQWPGIAVPVIDAKKKAFFCCLYRQGQKISCDMDTGPQEIAATLAKNLLPAYNEQILLFGPDAQMLHGQLMQLQGGEAQAVKAAVVCAENMHWGNAESLVKIALETDIFAGGDTGTNLFCGPQYIRKSDAEINLEGDARYL
jgi:tRNA threonylcarbamoyladenosine biosynthesis protein TsaB